MDFWLQGNWCAWWIQKKPAMWQDNFAWRSQERQVVRMGTLAALTAIPLPRSLYLVIIGYNSGRNQLAA
jgi:hypothetical protein